MNLEKRSPALENFKRSFKWRSIDGHIWTIKTMKSDHMLNLLKMLYNEIAPKYGTRQIAKTVDGLTSTCNNKKRIETILVTWDELRLRTDLNAHQRGILDAITDEIISLVSDYQEKTKVTLFLN